MPLIDLKTNLRDLKFGRDRIDGGSSNQPYITSPIPDLDKESGEFGFLNQDFILRGGSKAVVNSITDVERLGRYFLDIKNPSGLLFVAKQNLLSRTAVRTQASGKLVNEGVYTPISTLTQAGGNAFGIHVNKQGLNPFNGLGSLRTYNDVINPELGEAFSIKSINKNRLVLLAGSKITNTLSANPLTTNISLLPTNVLTYGGGPNSTLGIGNTNIKFADQRTGVNNINGKDIINGNYLTNRAFDTINRIEFDNLLPPLGVANKWFEATQLDDIVSSPDLNTDGYSYFNSDEAGNRVGAHYSDIKLGNWDRFGLVGFEPVLPPGGKIPDDNDPPPPLNYFFPNSNDTITYTQKQLNDISNSPSNLSDGSSYHVGGYGITTPGDFRALIRKTTNNVAITKAPDYSGPDAKNIESRVFLGDPGNRNGKKLTSYTNGTKPGEIYGYSGGNASINSYDKINALRIYSDTTPDDKNGNDLVKFRIGVIDNDDPSRKTYIHFRAFINQITDGYSSDWQDTRYIGRGEKFYTYTGFDRKVSLSWTVAAQSKAELIPMYKKLNFLASICAPDYSAAGYMRGNIVTLTIGGYFYEQPGIITGFSYEMNDDNATWEIGIGDEAGNDKTVKELPHMIKVSGFNFTPIHTFVPRKQQIGYDSQGDILTDANGYGPERYIALANGFGDNQNNYGPVYVNPVPEKKPVITDPPVPAPKPSLVLGNQIQNVSGGGTIDKTGNFNRNVNLNPINNGNTGVNRSINIEKIKKSKLPLNKSTFTGISVPA